MLSYLNGRLLPAYEATIPVDDAGFMLGTTIPEQLRTFGGKLFRLDEHLARLFRGLAIVGLEIPYSADELAQNACELVAHNHALLASPGDDLGLTMFVTPGPLAPSPGRGPLVCMHTRPLPWGAHVAWYDRGQDLVTTSIRQVPNDCWPVELKCRSRMHYWLADRAAARIQPAARALMLDHDDYVTEASSANVLIFRRDSGLISPPRESILPGISVAMLASLAGELKIPFSHAKLRAADVATADEVLLCSTSACVWPVLRFNGQAVGTGQPGEMWRTLIDAWSQHVGVDIVLQARQLA